MTVFILAAIGLTDAGTGLMCASILLIACSEGGDMQQDRSTGWRLGTNRVVQFRYQVIGIAMGAVLAVVLARVFLSAYPVLQCRPVRAPRRGGAEVAERHDLQVRRRPARHHHRPAACDQGAQARRAPRASPPRSSRKLVKRGRRYLGWARTTRGGKVFDFIFDAFLLPSPYASSFGGFVELLTCLWWAGGGTLGSLYEVAMRRWDARRGKTDEGGVPADMSTTSLVGGGLIAGDSLAALSVGILGLLQTIL